MRAVWRVRRRGEAKMCVILWSGNVLETSRHCRYPKGVRGGFGMLDAGEACPGFALWSKGGKRL